MSRKKKRYNVMVKETKKPNYIVQGCRNPAVMSKTLMCDGNCNICAYMYEYDIRKTIDLKC